MADLVRERWASGEVALNAWSTFGGATAARLLAAAGSDAVTVDLQHGEATFEHLGATMSAIDGERAVPFVRLGWNDPASAMRALDLGARGVICPMVNTAGEARAFVRACRYPPEGVRSYGPVQGAFGVGREQTERANAAVLAFAQIETAEGWANLDAICSTPGLDGLYVGPADLSLTLGLQGFADLGAKDMLDALDRVIEAAETHGVVAGIHAATADSAVEMGIRGFRFLGTVGDAELLRAGAEQSFERARERLRAERR